jgi:cytochrome c-type biogenesis protein CcmH/NrfG
MATSARLAQIQDMIAEDPHDVMLRYMLGMEHASLGDDAAAVEVFEKLTGYVPAFHMAGQALIRLGKLNEAAAALKVGILEARTQSDFHALGEMEALLATVE